MPLPKSILCSSCKKTYPEGWKRCPYCGHDELRARQESASRKFMQRKLQEFEQKTARERKPPRPDTRTQGRPGQQQAQGEREQGQRPGRGRRRRRRGARPPAAQSSAPPPPSNRPTPAPNQPRPEGGGGGGRRRRFRRRRRGGGGGGAGGSGGGGGEGPKTP